MRQVVTGAKAARPAERQAGTHRLRSASRSHSAQSRALRAPPGGRGRETSARVIPSCRLPAIAAIRGCHALRRLALVVDACGFGSAAPSSRIREDEQENGDFGDGVAGSGEYALHRPALDRHRGVDHRSRKGGGERLDARAQWITHRKPELAREPRSVLVPVALRETRGVDAESYAADGGIGEAPGAQVQVDHLCERWDGIARAILNRVPLRVVTEHDRVGLRAMQEPEGHGRIGGMQQ